MLSNVIYSKEDNGATICERIASKKEKAKAGKQRTKQGTNLPKGRPKKDTQSKESITKQEDKNLTASFRVFAECRPKTLFKSR